MISIHICNGTHIGNRNTGHYKYITKIKNIWYETNDSQTNCMTENEAVNQLEQNGILITYKINKDSTNQSAKDTKEIQKFHELIKYKKMSNNIKPLKKMANEIKQRNLYNKIIRGGSLGSKILITESNTQKKYTEKFILKKPDNSYFDPNRSCFYIRKKYF